MKAWLSVFFLLLLWPPLLLAQFTQVSGTIKDPTGLAYVNGTITPTLVISGSPTFVSSGFGYTPPNQPVGLDGNGSFVMQLADLSQINPPGGTWSFHVCSSAGTVQPGSPITNGPVCFDAPGFSIITGTAVDISSQLSAAAPRLTTGSGATVSAGTTGQFAAYTAPNTVAGSPNLNFGITTPGVITSTVPLTVVGQVIGTGFRTASTTPQGMNMTAGGLLSSLNGSGTSSTTAQTSGLGFTAGYPAIFASSGLANGTESTLQGIKIPMINGAFALTANSNQMNFNSTTPAAPANGINVTWNSSAPSSISAAVVGNGSATSCLLGTGLFSTCPTFGTTGAAALNIQTGSCFSLSAATSCQLLLNASTPGPFTVTPRCSATPVSTSVTSFFVSSLDNTQITVTWAPSQIQAFNVICIGP